MVTNFTDLHEDAAWRRHQDELDALPDRGEMKRVDAKRCLKCGHAVEMTKHSGGLYFWEPGTETIHVCKLTAKQLSSVNERELRRQQEQAEKKKRLWIGGRYVEI